MQSSLIGNWHVIHWAKTRKYVQNKDYEAK